MKKALFVILMLVPLLGTSQEILHYVETTGFNHNTRNQSLQMFTDILGPFGFTIVQDDDGDEFNSLANLDRFDLVIFSNTSGDQGLNATQRANFEQYIANGGSYLGIHAASDTYRHSTANGNGTGTWDYYAETVCGASVQNFPNHTINNYNGTMVFTAIGANEGIDDNLPTPQWNKPEEYYYWENGYLNTSDFVTFVEVLQTGNRSYDMRRMTVHGRDLPGGGRAVYTSLGHNQSDYTNPSNEFRQLIMNCLDWILTANTLPIIFLPPDELEEINPTIVNPVLNGEILFTGNMTSRRNLTLKIKDLLGREIHTTSRITPSSGVMEWREKVNLSGGIYMLSITDAGRHIINTKILVK